MSNTDPMSQVSAQLAELLAQVRQQQPQQPPQQPQQPDLVSQLFMNTLARNPNMTLFDLFSGGSKGDNTTALKAEIEELRKRVEELEGVRKK